MSRSQRSIEYLGKIHSDIHIYAILFRVGCLSSLPFSNELFDCVICSCKDDLILRLANDIAREVVMVKTNWVHTTGPHAERLHDLIDQTSVMVGRQMAIGDGSPMTCWWDEYVTIEQMADMVFSTFGGDHAVALIVGDEQDFEVATAIMRDNLLKRNQEAQDEDRAAS